VKAKGILTLLAASLSIAASARGQEMTTPVDIQVPILLKVLSFDRRLTDTKRPDLVVGVLFQSGYHTSVGVKSSVMDAAARAGSDPVAGRRLAVVAIDADEKGALETRLRASRAEVLYVTPIRALDLAAIVTVTRSLGILTVTGVPEFVRSGLSVGLDLKRDRPAILVNLKAARASGADLAAPLLKMATLVESREPGP